MIKEYTRGGSYKVFTKVGVPLILCEKVRRKLLIAHVVTLDTFL